MIEIGHVLGVTILVVALMWSIGRIVVGIVTGK